MVPRLCRPSIDMIQTLRVRSRSFLVLGSLAFAITIAIGGDEGRERLAPVSDALRSAMMRSDWLDARTEIARLEKEAAADGDLWAYVDALALASGGEPARARERLQGMLAQYPASAWVHKTRFQIAELARELGEVQAAEQILEEEAQRLRAGDRQRELARIYLDFADALSTEEARPSAEPRALDFARAQRLYAAALELEAPRDLADWARWRIGWCLEKLGDPEGARAAYEAYLAHFDPTRESSVGARAGAGGWVFEARAGRARTLLALSRAREARAAYEDLQASYELALEGRSGWGGAFAALSDERHAAARAAYEESFRAVADTWSRGDHLQGPLAIRALERFVEKFPSHASVARAAFAIGEHNIALGRSADARTAFHAMRALGEPATEEARLREEDAALRRRAIFEEARIAAAQNDHAAARALFEEYVRRFPTGADWAAAQQGILDVEFAVGERARARGEWGPARAAWTSFLAAHPLDPRARWLSLAIGELWREQALELEKEAREAGRLESEAPALEALLREALAQYARVLSMHPSTDEASSALYLTGLVHETSLDELEEAIAAYRRCDFGRDAGHARARLELLTQPSLAVVTERTVRGGEPAVVRLQVRNVEKVEVELFALDLEAYFRKHLTHANVEALDLDLIAADRSIEVAIERYRPYAPIEQLVTLPVEGAGVWAVTVSTEKERATTLCVRSDLELVVESTRREALAYVENVRDGRPAGGVRVLLATLPARDEAGVPSIHEIVTGADGVARLELDDLQVANEVRALAVHEDHFASQGLDLGAIGSSSGLAPRDYVYTDRSAYRPGQRVHWRAILRAVKDGAFTFEEGASWRVEVFDPAGRGLLEERGALSAFGTLSGSFELPAEAAPGGWSIALEDRSGRRVVQGFTVEDYRLERAELVLTPEREVYYRGERVEIAVQARWYWGEPITDSRVAYFLPDGSQGELSTDEQGRGKIELDTRELLEAGVYAVRAALMEEGVVTETVVQLATQGYRATLALARPLVLAGERFTLTLATEGPDGKPLSTAMQLAVLRRESTREGGWAEVETARHALTTDAKDGEARLTTSIEKGGNYVLRAQGDDRFGNPVVAEVALAVSGEEDEVKLRFLVDDARVDVGETLALELHNRAGPGLALVTFHAEKVLGHRVIELGEGSNRVELAVEHAHYPSFAVTVAAIRGTRLHHASTAFEVERHLVIEIRPAAATVVPGTETSIDLVVTDQLGRPVSAELSLAVVDEALYELFPDPTPPLEAFFESAHARWTAMSVASSCGFRYQGRTRAIASELLAELERARRESQLGEVAGWLEEETNARYAYALEPQQQSAGPSSPGPQGATIDAGSDEFRLGQLDDKAELRSARKSLGGRGEKSKSAAAAEARARVTSETAFFAPSIVTDEQGRANVRFPMPETSSRWRITCRGVGRETVLGEARSQIVSRAEFQVALETPAMLTEGDAPRLVARIHKNENVGGSASLRLRVRGGEQDVVLPATIELAAGTSTAEHVFPPFTVGASGSLSCELEVTATLAGSSIEARTSEQIAVRPWGLEESVAKSGVLTSEQSFELALPEGTTWREREIELSIGPGVDRMLIDEALGGGGNVQGWRIPPAETIADAAAMLEGHLALADALQASGRAELPEAQELRSRANALVARLVTSQDAGGGWSATGRDPQMLVTATAAATRALAIARAHGLSVPPGSLSAAANALRASFANSGPVADESRAMAAAALAALDEASFEQVSRLHRDRAALSDVALAYLALALADMRRAPMAREVAELLAERARTSPDGAHVSWSAEQNAAWNRCGLETSALVVLALERALPTSPRIAEGVAHLVASRPWYPGRARGRAIAAIARYQGETAPARERVRVLADVAGLDERTLVLDPDAPGLSFRVAVPDGAPRSLRITLRLEGRGSPSFGAVLNGFTSEVVARNEVRGARRTLHQDYLAPPAIHRGKPLPEGFSVLTQYSQGWTNPVRTLALGRTVNATIDLAATSRNGELASHGDWTVLEIPLPGGARLLEGSLQGQFLSSREEAGRLIVQVGPLEGWRQLHFTLVGTLPGKWRTLPPTLWRAFEPTVLAVAEPIPFEVLGRGESSGEERRATPDELYHLGTRAWEAGDGALARATLTSLWESFGELLARDPARETVRILFLASVAERDSRSIVRYFELLKERYPELTISFDDTFAVGAAYRELEDYERARLVFRAIIEGTFGKDLKVVGTLEAQDELAGALDVLQRLWLEYPDLPVVVETQLAYADKLFGYARSEVLPASLRRAGRDRTRLAADGLRSLERFLVLYAHDPLASEAALGLVSAELELEHHERAAQLAGEMAPLHSEPRYQDAFLYSRAVALWYMGQDQQAVDLLTRIAEAVWTDAAGIEHPSANRELALYILGQIHHARRESKSASEYYERVAHLFVDAREALAGFRQKVLALEEVTSVRPGEKLSLALTHRNVTEIELLVYGVDLMTLTLRERNLSHVTAVNLAGIAPTVKKTVELPAGEELRESESEIELELAEPGAYLVICRGGELFASGLVLVSDIELEVGEEPAAGRVRVEVLNAADGRYLRGVDVRVIGSANETFFSGKTDPRGLYVAEGVSGASTVIARLDERHYAFHRGAELVAQIVDQEQLGAPMMGKDYLQNVRELNEGNFSNRQQRLQQEIQRDRSGVQLQKIE